MGFPFINLNPGLGRVVIDPAECKHGNIARTIIFSAIDVYDHTGWVCQDCGTEFAADSREVLSQK